MNDTAARYEILPNGMELISLDRSFAPVVSIQCWLRAGSIMEIEAEEHPRGIAHFLEHMTFKGTMTRGVGEISSKIEGWGGEINAYTTFDRTVYYLTVAREFAEEALELLADAVFCSKIDPVEVEREREVILEEVRRSLDDPGTRAAQKIFARAYDGSEAGRPVIGSAESVAAITREQLCRFRDKFYQPSNCAFVIVGDFNRDSMVRFLGGLAGPAGTQAGKSRTIWSATDYHARIPLRRNELKVELVRGDYQQVRFDFAISCPELEHVDTAALDMCAFLLGGGDLGLLNRELRDGMGLVSSAAATIFSPAFPGLFEVSIVTADETALQAIEAVAGILVSFPDGESWSQADLDRAKSAIRAEKVFRDETIDGLARVGFGVSTSQKHQHEQAWMQRIERLTVEDLISAWNRWIAPERFHVVGVAPDRLGINEADVEKAFLRGCPDRPSSNGKKASGAGTRQPRKTDALETFRNEIKPGITFLYRQRPGSGLLSLVMATEGGQRAEFDGAFVPGIFNAMASNLARATSRLSPEECSWMIESSGADLSSFSGKDSLGFRLTCLTQDHERLTDLLLEMMLDPRFPRQQFETFQREAQEYFRHQADSPGSLCMRRLQNAVLGAHPYGRDLAGTSEQVAAMTPEILYESYQRWIQSGPWVIAGCGDLPPELVMRLLENGLRDFNPTSEARVFDSDHVPSPRSVSRETIPMDRQQVHFAVGMPGPGWSSPDRYAVDVLCNILGGTGGRMFTTLRDRDGLAYSVAPVLSYGKNRGLVGAYIACSQEKLAAAEAGIWRELEEMAAKGPTDQEMARSKNFIKGNHVMELQSGESQASTMALMELYGVGYNAWLEYPGQIEGVGSRAVTEAARRFLDKNYAQTVLVGL